LLLLEAEQGFDGEEVEAAMNTYEPSPHPSTRDAKTPIGGRTTLYTPKPPKTPLRPPLMRHLSFPTPPRTPTTIEPKSPSRPPLRGSRSGNGAVTFLLSIKPSNLSSLIASPPIERAKPAPSPIAVRSFIGPHNRHWKYNNDGPVRVLRRSRRIQQQRRQ
jgi:hypothetical protein